MIGLNGANVMEPGIIRLIHQLDLISFYILYSLDGLDYHYYFRNSSVLCFVSKFCFLVRLFKV